MRFAGRTGFFARRHRAQVRARLRAWTWLMKQADPLAVISVATQIEVAPLLIPTEKLAKLVPGLSASDVDRNVRQRLCSFAMGESVLPNLTLHLAGMHRPACVAMPRSWRRKLAELGVPVRHGLSRLLWAARIARMWAAGAYQTGSLLSWAWTGTPPARETPYMVVFLPSADMAAGDAQPHNHDFLSTFLKSPARDEHERDVWIVLNRPGTSVIGKSTRVRHGFPSLRSWRARIAFSVTALGFVASDLFHVMIGEWWRAVLQSERILALYVRRMPRSDIAGSYVFTSANLQVRPLWTHFAERAGARVVMAFISTNFHTLTPVAEGPTPINVGFRSLSWPFYAVWGDAQRRLLRDAGHGSAHYIQMGPVGYVEDLDTDIRVPADAIVVFDVAPLRRGALANIGYPSPYFDKAARALIEDVVEVGEALNIPMVLKQKPKPDRNSDGRYRSLLARLAASNTLSIVPTGVSPHRIIVQGACVISAPFTSTAFVARSLGKPSAFYDPLCVLNGANPNGDGIPILRGKAALAAWIRENHSRAEERPLLPAIG